MCGEYGHSIDYDLMQQQLSDAAKESLARSERLFAEMCERGEIFHRPPTPIRIEDIAYG